MPVQLLKIINRKPGLTEEQIDNEAVLMRAYGNGTEILIDRESTKTQGLFLALNPPSHHPIFIWVPLVFIVDCAVC